MTAGTLAALLMAAPPAMAQQRRGERAAPTASAAPRSAIPAGHVPLTLVEAVYLGLRDNRAIRSEFQQRIADRFSLRVAERAFTPRLDVGINTSYARTAGVTSRATTVGPVVTWDVPTGARFTFGWANNNVSTRGQPDSSFSQLSFQVVQPLLAGGGIDYAMAPIRIARIQERNNQLRLKGSVIDQITGIIQAYRALVQGQEQLRIADEALLRARELLEVNRALIAAGRLAQVELVQSEAAIAQQELGVVSARNGRESARLALLTLMGVDQSSRVWAVERPAAPSVEVTTERALAVALDQQPSFLQSLLAIEIGRINLDVARNQRLWDVSLLAGAGPQASRAGYLDTVAALGRVRSDFNVGLVVNIPIGTLTREQAEVNATIALRQSQIAADAARARVRQQVEDAARGVEAQRRQAELARRARELARQQLQAELIKLQAGRSSNFQVVSFQTSLQQAESQELSAVIAYQNALTSLDQVLGTTLETWQISLNRN
ncbi:TolC family protein [Rhodovarius lipocyclicus]|uniref:TolC family protein n=1 Tax=Rhodovarius lipocyclicus TaxID=268410 RepID=UPI00135B8CA5|nr:TolC family protein [Rhodovarius lipocyclicus]